MTSPAFYQVLSRYYDGLFPVDEEEMAFLLQRLGHVCHLLDIGCGTGNKTVHFSPAAGSITAFDYDQGMIDKARTSNARDNIHYTVLDMARMDKIFAGSSFDAALCLGNTLVHLDGPGQIGAFLADLYELLSPGAIFILQILNYDRILDRHITSLPPLQSQEAVFSRRYAQDGEKLRFITSITVKETGEAFESDVALYPLRLQELQELLAKAGFSAPFLYGGYNGEPYSKDSFVCLAESRKPSA